MRKFKTLFILMFIVTSISLSAQNNQKGKQEFSAEDNASRQTEMLKEKLDLTSAQEKKVKAIYLKYAQQQESEIKNRQTSQEDQSNDSGKKDSKSQGKSRAGNNENMEKMNNEIKAVLTSDQLEKFNSSSSQDSKPEMKKNNENNRSKTK